MSGFDVDIVSPQFPCGAAWLANALLELGFALPELWGFDTAREWLDLGDGRWRYVAEDGPWAQTLAGPRPGREFQLAERPRLRFTHAFPWQIERAPRTVLFVRDPRDALYSEWRRHQRNEGLDPDIGLPAFARAGFWGGPVAYADLLWLHLACWLHPDTLDLAPESVREAASDRVLLLRFEDTKTDPAACLRRVLDWLGLSRSPTAIEAAVAASRVERLQRVEADRAMEAGSRVYNRAGLAFEWQRAWWPHWHGLLGPHWAPLLQTLGYPALQSIHGEPLQLDLPAALAWRGLPANAQAPWLARLTPACVRAASATATA